MTLLLLFRPHRSALIYSKTTFDASGARAKTPTFSAQGARPKTPEFDAAFARGQTFDASRVSNT